MNTYNNIEDYYEMNFADGGSIEKTKEIITKKIGFSEELADYFISRSQKFAVWLADIILKEELSNWMGSKKQYLESKYAKLSSIGFNYNGGIRQILDWLQHPITPKQELRKLTYDDALEKAKQWHEELTVLGGDIDFKEPEKNQILKKYPINSEGIEYYWVFIPSNYCDLESSRMGHCGRTGYGNTLISLRSIKPYGKGHTISDSHVTIAYGSDGLFYQVKGKKNQKPNEKYQPYIFDLIKEMLTNQELKEKFNDDETFVGFGSEYDSKEDYGYGDMSTDQIRELYEIKPSLFDDANGYFMLFNAGVLTKSDLSEINNNSPKVFESFKNQNLLFENGIIDNRPSTLVKVEKSCDDVSSLLDVDRDIRGDLIEDILCGDTNDLVDGWSYYYENPIDLVDNLNKENEQRVIDEISRITGLEKSVVEENGISYYLEGEDEDYDKDSFDNIIRVLASAKNSADNNDYYNYLYKEIENSLEELGEVHSLNDEGVKMTVDLSNHLSMDEISESMEEYDFTDISDLFDELVSRGEIDLPNLSIDDRYSAYGSNEDFNAYVADSDFEQGYKKGGSVGVSDIRYNNGGIVTEKTKILYHGTSLNRANKILKDGFDLQKQSEKTKQGHKKAISFTSSYQEAKEHSDWAAEKFNDKPAIISITIPFEILSGKSFFDMNMDMEKAYKLFKLKKIDGVSFCDYQTGDGCEEMEVAIFNIEKLNKNKLNFSIEYSKYELGGELTLTTEQVENKLGRKLHWWNDDVVSINGIEYKKVFLRPEYIKK